MSERAKKRVRAGAILRILSGRLPLRRRVTRHIRLNPGRPCRGSLIWWLCLLVSLGFAGTGSAQEVLEEQALTLFKTGDFDRARTAFQQILTANPRDPVALYHLGQMEADGARAEQYYLQLLYHAPNHHYVDDALLAIARIYYQHGRFREAAQTCNRLLASYPASRVNDQARYRLGLALLADDRPVLARVTFMQLLAVHPQSQYMMPTRLGIADTFRAEGAFIKAARAYLKFESEYRKNDSLHVALFRAGQCLETADKQLEARHVYQRLTARFPDSQEAQEVRRRFGEQAVDPSSPE